MIVLTDEYPKRKIAAAVPGAVLEGRRWVLPLPNPRSATVALKLFPHLANAYPELVELRAATFVDAEPVDYAARLDLRVNAPRVESAMNARGWSLCAPQVTPTNSNEMFQMRDLGFAAACLREHGGFYLGWDRGLGKTLAFCALAEDLDVRAGLVVAPNTAKQNTWAKELAWATPWFTVLVMPNDAKQRAKCLANAQDLYRNGEPFVLVTHYESLPIVAGKVKRTKTTTVLDGWKKLGIEWDLVDFDEGHRLANPDAQWTKAASKIPAKAKLISSGSVFQNKWEELYGPLHVLFPESYKYPRRDWSDRYLDYVENGYTRVCVGVKPERVDAMRDELGRFMVLRRKQNLAIMRRADVALSPEQRRVYDELAHKLLAELPNGERLKTEDGIALLGKLRQVASGLDAFDPEAIVDSTKLDQAEAIIRTGLVIEEDFVVFVWYKALGHALERRLAKAGIESWRIDGDVPQKQRDTIIRAFQAGERRVLIGTIATMGESVNLQRANHVVRIDRSFNPALNQQAVDRVDRQGQTRTVYCTDIIAADTVDESVVMPTLANKEALRAIVLGQ